MKKDLKFDKELLKEINDAENENKYDKTVTYLMKKQFADEIRNGLGKQIKENKNNYKTIKVPLYRKIVVFIKNLFIRF